VSLFAGAGVRASTDAAPSNSPCLRRVRGRGSAAACQRVGEATSRQRRWWPRPAPPPSFCPHMHIGTACIDFGRRTAHRDFISFSSCMPRSRIFLAEELLLPSLRIISQVYGVTSKVMMYDKYVVMFYIAARKKKSSDFVIVLSMSCGMSSCSAQPTLMLMSRSSSHTHIAYKGSFLTTIPFLVHQLIRLLGRDSVVHHLILFLWPHRVLTWSRRAV
jgi:hypothetical protein